MESVEPKQQAAKSYKKLHNPVLILSGSLSSPEETFSYQSHLTHWKSFKKALQVHTLDSPQCKCFGYFA